MNLPNKITLARICLIPLMIIVPFLGIQGTVWYGLPIDNLIILIIFLIASFTDFLDGYIARKNNIVTDFGKFLDPLADKLLVLTALIMLVEMQSIPAWIPVVILARELMVSGIRMIAAGTGKVIAASWFGKVKTVSQMLAISLAFLDTSPFMEFLDGKLSNFALPLNILMSLSMFICVIVTIWSGIDYFLKSKDIILKSK